MQLDDMQLGEKLRLGMRRLASGVGVLSTRKGDEKFAMTASSITSLSDDPASLLICVNKSAAIQPLLTKGQSISVSILGAQQENVSNKCAQKGAGSERFSVGKWVEEEVSNTPYLQDAQVVFFCDVDNDCYEYGTHQIVIGRLVDIFVPDINIDPLLYLDGAYRKIAG